MRFRSFLIAPILLMFVSPLTSSQAGSIVAFHGTPMLGTPAQTYGPHALQVFGTPVTPASWQTKGQKPGRSAYADIIARHARANGVPVALANAIVAVESRYNPRVTGRAGEIGLMQIKLQTARAMGYTGSRAGLYDPETNIRFGMKYLAGAHKLGGGTTCGTILKYQGGHYAKRMQASTRKYCARVQQLLARS